MAQGRWCSRRTQAPLAEFGTAEFRGDVFCGERCALSHLHGRPAGGRTESRAHPAYRITAIPDRLRYFSPWQGTVPARTTGTIGTRRSLSRSVSIVRAPATIGVRREFAPEDEVWENHNPLVHECQTIGRPGVEGRSRRRSAVVHWTRQAVCRRCKVLTAL
jgi:hypothetical protein